MSYPRPQGASAEDFLLARLFEEEVGSWLGEYKLANLDSETDMDFVIPGFQLDVKEKRQPLTARWHLLDGVPESDLFVLDEPSIRKAAAFYPNSYFLIRDLPGDRLFLARVDEVFCSDRARVNRVGPTGHPKGKWVLNLNNFRQIELDEVLSVVLDDQNNQAWMVSDCIGLLGVPDV